MMKNLMMLLLLCSSFTLLGTTYTWTGGTGKWEDPNNWSPAGLPGMGDYVEIPNGTVNLRTNTGVTRLTISSSGALNIDPSGSLTVNLDDGQVRIQGALLNKGVVEISRQSANPIGFATVEVSGNFHNEGSLKVTSGSGTHALHTSSGSTFLNDSDVYIVTQSFLTGTALLTDGGFVNNATIEIQSSGSAWSITGGNQVNHGLVEISTHGNGVQSYTYFENFGEINVVSLSGYTCFRNSGTFKNHASGTLQLRNGGGLRNNSNLVNHGLIEVRNATITNAIVGDFTNSVSGNINVQDFDSWGIFVDSYPCIFKNQGQITLSNAPGANDGLRNFGTFRNLAHGTLDISNTGETGIYNGGTVLNKGDLNISDIQGANGHGIGIVNSANSIFRNWNGGSLQMQSISKACVINNSGALFDNSNATLICAEGGSISIENSGTFHNRRCGQVYAPKMIFNWAGADFINDAFLFSSYKGSLAAFINGDFTNNGLIEDLYDAFDGVSMTNNGIIAAPITGPVYVGQPVSNALGLGSLSNATVLGWWVDEQGNIPAGTYDAANNTFTPNNNAGKKTKLYVEIDLDIDINCKAVMVEVRFLPGINFGQSQLIGDANTTTAPASALQVYPNPCPGGDCQVRINLEAPGAGTLHLYNTHGQLVWQQAVYVETTVTLPAGAQRLQPGTYWLRWKAERGGTSTTSIVVLP